jgi:hypothetical protein
VKLKAPKVSRLKRPGYIGFLAEINSLQSNSSVCAHVCMWVGVQMHVYMWVCACACVRVCALVCASACMGAGVCERERENSLWWQLQTVKSY